MAQDRQHQNLVFVPNEISHLYGDKIHILSSPQMLTLLAKLGHPETTQPLINDLVTMLYQYLSDVVINSLFPRTHAKVSTRMDEFYEGEVLKAEVPCVCVDLARAGTLPSQILYHKLNYLMNPNKVRQDHFYVARECDKDGKVTGVNVSGSKIGGEVEGSIVLFPDPMGATGGTIVEVYDHYKKRVGGKPLMMIALHLIVTPEYLKKVTTLCPDLHVFSLRLDRGLSDAKVLQEVPGTTWENEKGLNQKQYIIPGAGGLGEILNNSFC